jgi:hypothetical protein
MSSNRRRTHTPRDVRRPDGRYVRWSFRYNAWQVRDAVTGAFRNIKPEMARCYAAAGFPIGVHGGDA